MINFESLPDGRARLTMAVSEVIWEHSGVTDIVQIPRGFVTDGASIPRCVWPIVGPPIRSNHFRAAVVHDWLCENAQSYDERLMGDAKFFALLRKYGVPRWKRSVMYLAVRLAGWWTWCHKSRSTRNSWVSTGMFRSEACPSIDSSEEGFRAVRFTASMMRLTAAIGMMTVIAAASLPPKKVAFIDSTPVTRDRDETLSVNL